MAACASQCVIVMNKYPPIIFSIFPPPPHTTLICQQMLNLKPERLEICYRRSPSVRANHEACFCYDPLTPLMSTVKDKLYYA